MGRWLNFAFLSVLALAGCGAVLTQPVAPDVAWASARWPGTTLDDLQGGRTLFVNHCAGCHTLPLPESRPWREWQTEVESMQQQAALSQRETSAIVRFLSSASARLRPSP